MKKDLIFISDPFLLATQYTWLSYLFEETLETICFPNTTIFDKHYNNTPYFNLVFFLQVINLISTL